MNPAHALLAASTFLVTALASAQAITPGAYVTEGGWGRVDIGKDGAFVLEATGSNAHTCNMEGRIAGGRAAPGEGCTVKFERKGAALDVAADPATAANQDACRSFCGARAHFAGTYFAEPAACRDSEVKSQRKAFMADYQAKRYAQAATRLEKTLGTCGRLLWWMTEAEVRNDLALAQHRAGDKAACSATLKPLEKLFDPAVGFPPAEKDWADRVLPQIRFNMTLCGMPAPAVRQ